MSDSSSVLEVVGKLSLALSLVAFNGFFVAAEFALVKVRDTQLEGYVQRRHRRAGMVRHILGHLDGYLSACQLGITLASLALGWVAEPVFAALLEPVFGWFQIESAQLRHLLSASVGIMAVTFSTLWWESRPPNSSPLNARCLRRSGWPILSTGSTW